MRFVIVEDEIRIREGIRRLLLKLDRQNIVLGEASNGEEGLALILREKPDVIITDVRMPVMDGLEMLEKLYQQGCSSKAIVLSAYSEFEYARTAIRLGVTEYLVKPIVVTEFTEAIGRIQKERAQEQQKKPGQLGSLDQICRNLLFGDLTIDEDILDYLEKAFGIHAEMPAAMLVAYWEEWEERSRTGYLRKIKGILKEKPEILFCILEDERQKEVILLLYGYTEKHNVKRWIQSHFLRKEDSVLDAALGWTEIDSIRTLKKNYEELERYLEWNILLGDEIIISYPEICQIQTALCVYPMEIERQMKLALCSGDYPKIQKQIQRFQAYFQGQSVYEPKKIKECYVRFFWAVMNSAKETGNTNFENLEQRTLLEQITHARTRRGLARITEEWLSFFRKTEQEIDNLNVKRAVAMIHEFYRTGITLDEIALKLGITPEYLGTQFHQVMGVNFSTYLKNFRIGKAKELLIGTPLKLYEIAEQTGYSDPKYFSKVFKAETGQLPADYRRTHK